MRTITLLSMIALIFMVSCSSCSKDGDFMGNGGGSTKQLPGTLYWYFAGDVGTMDFKSGKSSERIFGIGAGSSRFDSYDVSWDNKKVLLAMDVEGTFNFYERRFVFRDLNSKIDYQAVQAGGNKFDINYEWDDIGITDGHISPNEEYIALDAQHFADLPITIINAKTGRTVNSWTVDGVSFLNYGVPVWTSDNTLYFRIGNSVYRSSASDGYGSAARVFTMAGISNVTVNPQGTKLVFRKDRHLWMCNIDGGDLKQITNSKTSEVITYDGEHRPTFSPDGKYIAFTGSTQRGTPFSDHDYPDGSWVASVGGKYGYIVVIPSDGKMRDLEDKNSGAIWLKDLGSDTYGLACSNYLIWR